MATESITEPIVNPIGIAGATTELYTNTSNIYDIAIGGQPFLLGASDKYPYQRQTATYRKQQFDNTKEVGEQTFEGWWLRSQSSFHLGSGINYLDPYTGENVQYRFYDSEGIDVWTPGTATLLKGVTSAHITTGTIRTNGRPWQYLRSIKWTTSGTTYDGVLLHDEYDVDKIDTAGNVVHFVDYNAGSDDPVYAICDDGTTAYWVTNDTASGKLEVNKKSLNAGSGTSPTVMFTSPGITVTNGVMEYVKERIVMCANDKVYEFSSSAAALPTAVYSHNDPDHIFTSITASGTAIYISGYSGIQSNIYKFTLNSSGVMPTITSAITAAEMPTGEIIYSIKYYLGYMLIGTNKGVRVATVSDDGSIIYGPLLFESEQPIYDFAFRDKYAWCSSNVNGKPGVTRIDLSTQIEPLRFPYANDLYYNEDLNRYTTSCAFADGTERLVFCTNNNGTDGTIYIEDASTLTSTGFITTGFIRYATIEKKYFKLIKPRFDTPMYGTCVISTKEIDGDINSIITIAGSTPALNTDLATNITSPQEELAFKFTFNRDTTDTTKGPAFDGYQVKSLPAVVRARQLTVPLINYDFETDRYGIQNGYEGRAWVRLQALENLEAAGDTVVIQDFTTGEQVTGLIEQLSFERTTPADRRYSGFGGIVYASIRTV